MDCRHVRELYDSALGETRKRFAAAPAIGVLLAADVDPLVMELFLIHFSSLGVGLTTPVEDWLLRAGKRCEEMGLQEVGRSLRSHAGAEAGHQLMMIADTHALVERWNVCRTPLLDADQLLARSPTAGGRAYRQLHEDNIAGDTPFAQVAIEYEIEKLPVHFGARFMERCRGLLGDGIARGLSFTREHITLDVGHTHFNERLLEKLLQANPSTLRPLVNAGQTALEAYGQFVEDSLALATADAHEVRKIGAGLSAVN
jgi:hypothetical protein